ncbi:MAG: hypothetical protein VCB43_06550, partial [Myxococcota bacterium]
MSAAPSAAPVVEEVLPELRSCGPEPERGVPAKVRTFVEQVRAHLTELHRDQATGIEVIATHSDLTD